jgi:S-adenosylmethionine hydrolase
MIVLITDFGISDPYIGQLQAAISQIAPEARVINLFPDLPAFAIQESSYLLAAYQDYFPANTVFLCVVDPGVGTDRAPVVVKAQNKIFVGPDNGLFEIVKRRSDQPLQWRIDYQPEDCSGSFHGRDIFAPVAAMLDRGETPPLSPMELNRAFTDWPDDLCRIIYQDHYGNAMTGIRGTEVADVDYFLLAGARLNYRRTFAEGNEGEAFWYRNSNGLIEFAMNQASVSQHLHLSTGDEFEWKTGA